MEFCDLCAAKNPAWEYPSRNRLSWLVCDGCQARIAADDRDGLARRGLEFFLPLSGLTRAQLFDYVRDLQTGFWEEVTLDRGRSRL